MGDGAPGGVDVHVWAASPDPAPGDLDLLDDDERAARARLRHPADRDRYVAAHAARRHLVGARLGVPPAAVRFAPTPCPLCGGPHGRPVVVGGAVEVSLARTSDLVAVALAPVVVGLDVEAVARPVGLDDLAPALHPAERATRPDRTAALRLWVRKEAYLKALGTGLGVDPAEVDVRHDPPGWRLVDVDAGPGHLAAVAVAIAAPGTPVTVTSTGGPPSAPRPVHRAPTGP